MGGWKARGENWDDAGSCSLVDPLSCPSSPLIAEVVSLTDSIEMVFAEAQEYLQSSCEEVWLVLPKSRYVFVMARQQRLWFAAGEIVSTQTLLQGFNVVVDELLA